MFLIMFKRKILKELMKFVRSEVQEKKADWGELRRFKKQTLIKKGLPNVPDLLIQTDAGLSFLVVICWKKELRLYFFNSEGEMLHGQSFFEDIDTLYEEYRFKTKKIARYPSEKPKITQAQRNQQYDKLFKEIWIQLASLLKIQTNIRKNRPLIKEMKHIKSGMFGTEVKNNFIYIPQNSSKLKIIFAYYSLYFFIPSQFRENNDMGEALAFKILQSFRKFQNDPFPKDRSSYNFFSKLQNWTQLKPSEIISILKKISLYYQYPFTKEEFLFVVNQDINFIRNLSRMNIPELFCRLFTELNNMNFLVLSALLGLPFDFLCTIPPHLSDEEPIKVYKWIKSYEFSKLFEYLDQIENRINSGLEIAIQEALNYQYTTLLKIELNSSDPRKVTVFNSSDIIIFLTSATEILPDGKEREILFDSILIDAKRIKLLDLSELKIFSQNPIRFQYELFRSLEKINKPIFKGTIII